MTPQQLTRFMPAVIGYRERLAGLQGAWDSLALLSHLNDDGTNLGNTRRAFESLAVELVTHLADEAHKKALLAVKARAQVAVDILVRNLYERTADIGVLCKDAAIRRFAREIPRLRELARGTGADAERAARTIKTATDSLRRRLMEYVAKYSVYHNVVIIGCDGQVLLQLPHGQAPAETSDPLVAATLNSDEPYVETYRHSDIVPEVRTALIYSHRIVDDGQIVGVLCLCFKLMGESGGIFEKLRDKDDWTVLALLRPDGEVISSSDVYQLPVGARITPATSESGGIVRFAGREYLAVTRSAHPYQGYAGPSWLGHAMVPLDRAFEAQANDTNFNCAAEILAGLRDSEATFSTALREIPRQADAVQGDLNRSVWNGSIRLSMREATNAVFAKALLREISNLGRRTQEVFERSISELHETVVSSVLHDSAFRASVAIDLLARNLYERANDCRWWALDPRLAGFLSGKEGCDFDTTTLILQEINTLSSVYHVLVLFDIQGRVVAVSRSEHEQWVGQVIEEPWVEATLTLSGTQAFANSEFAPSKFYGGRPTLIYGAAIRSSQGRLVGGIGVVFDAEPQLHAMLVEALPHDERGQHVAGAVALFVDRDWQIMSAAGDTAAIEQVGIETLQRTVTRNESNVIQAGGKYYAIGAARDAGYREYPGLGGQALVLIPLGDVSAERAQTRPPLPQRSTVRHEGATELVEFATFAVGSGWYAVPTANVIEAVDGRTLQPMPAQPECCAGFLMYNGQPIVVADLARLLAVPRVGRANTVIVLQVPGGREPFGVLVEALGDVSEVPANQVLPIAGVQNKPGGQLIEHAIQPPDSESAMVVTLNVGLLMEMLQGLPQMLEARTGVEPIYKVLQTSA